MTDSIELDIQRQNTLAFIAANPSSITLIPKAAKQRTPSGGWSEADGEPRAPQTMRIIELGQQYVPPEFKLQDGKLRTVVFELLAPFDAAMAVDDYWVAPDLREWEIADVIHENQYERRALVVEHGR